MLMSTLMLKTLKWTFKPMYDDLQGEHIYSGRKYIATARTIVLTFRYSGISVKETSQQPKLLHSNFLFKNSSFALFIQRRSHCANTKTVKKNFILYYKLETRN